MPDPINCTGGHNNKQPENFWPVLPAQTADKKNNFEVISYWSHLEFSVFFLYNIFSRCDMDLYWNNKVDGWVKQGPFSGPINLCSPTNKTYQEHSYVTKALLLKKYIAVYAPIQLPASPRYNNQVIHFSISLLLKLTEAHAITSVHITFILPMQYTKNYTYLDSASRPSFQSAQLVH